ncbi:MAG: hypothetical protein QM766_24105 [Burkholderiaceae bacterium]
MRSLLSACERLHAVHFSPDADQNRQTGGHVGKRWGVKAGQPSGATVAQHASAIKRDATIEPSGPESPRTGDTAIMPAVDGAIDAGQEPDHA